MSRLVVSEIVSQTCPTSRVQTIEKWTAVADICRCLHNFNGILQICSAFANSAVFRLRHTWTRRVSKAVLIGAYYYCPRETTQHSLYSRHGTQLISYSLLSPLMDVTETCEMLYTELIRPVYPTLACTYQTWPI